MLSTFSKRVELVSLSSKHHQTMSLDEYRLVCWQDFEDGHQGRESWLTAFVQELSGAMNGKLNHSTA